MQCPVCGAQNETGTAFCYQCGSALRPNGNPAPATGQTVTLGRDQWNDPGSVPPPASIPSFGNNPYPQPTTPAPGHDARVYDVPQSQPGPFLEVPQRSITPVAPPVTPYVVTSPPMPTTQTSTMAVFSLVLGVLSWILLPIIGAFGAIITGHMARREVQQAAGRLSGDGLAIAGLILGYLNLLVGVGVCALFTLLIAG